MSVCLAVPDKPRGVVVNASTPNTVRLQVLPPGEFNGLAVRGYRVKYEDRVYDFDTGNRALLSMQMRRRNQTGESAQH